MKQFFKNLIPAAILQPLLPIFHWLQAAFWDIRYGFPAWGMNIIGITGTNGKTTTAVILGKILEKNGWKVGINSTAFYQIGVDITINDTNMTVVDPARFYKLLKEMKQAKVDWIILETTSHALAQHRVLGIPYRAAAMTNLTQDHLDWHGTMDKYAAAKARLFKKGAKLHVFNRDDEWYEYFSALARADRTLSYGTTEAADCRILNATLGPSQSRLELKLERVHIDPVTNLVGKFNAYNALCAATIAHGLGLEPTIIKEGLEAITQVPGRMETIKISNGRKVVIDYAHTPDALANVLESLRSVAKKRIITVFGATGDRDRTKRPIMGRIVTKLSDVAIVTDDDPFTENPITIRAEVLQGAHDVIDGAELHEIADRRAAIAQALELSKRGDTILLAGVGHQPYRVLNEGKVEWSESGVVAEELAKLDQ